MRTNKPSLPYLFTEPALITTPPALRTREKQNPIAKLANRVLVECHLNPKQNKPAPPPKRPQPPVAIKPQKKPTKKKPAAPVKPQPPKPRQKPPVLSNPKRVAK